MRWLVAALLAANLGFWAWTQGWLDSVVGASPHGDRAPERIARQVRPERVSVLRERPAASAPGRAAPAPSGADADADAPAAATSTVVAAADITCLEAGPFAPAELAAAEAALVRAALPAGSWSDLRIEQPGRWMVYLGRFASREQQAQREDELRRQRIAVEPLRNAPDLEPGLSLGRYDDRAAADAALAALQQRGVRNARVLTVAAPSSAHLLRIERADAALQTQLAALRAPALGAGFVRCGSADAAPSVDAGR